MTQNDYPLILNVDHIAAILGVSKRKAYRVMNDTNFPLVKIGGTKRVGRDAFFGWINQQTNKHS